MRAEPFFTDYNVRKGDRVYVLDRRETIYEIEECEAASVGNCYVTVRYGSGLKERFERLSEIRPGYGLWLEWAHFDGYPTWRKRGRDNERVSQYCGRKRVTVLPAAVRKAGVCEM